MIKITAKDVKRLQNGEIKQADFAQDLINTYPASEIALAFVELLATTGKKVSASTESAEPIIKVTAEQKEELLSEIGALIEVIKVRGPRKKKEE